MHNFLVYDRPIFVREDREDRPPQTQSNHDRWYGGNSWYSGWYDRYWYYPRPWSYYNTGYSYRKPQVRDILLTPSHLPFFPLVLLHQAP